MVSPLQWAEVTTIHDGRGKVSSRRWRFGAESIVGFTRASRHLQAWDIHGSKAEWPNGCGHDYTAARCAAHTQMYTHIYTSIHMNIDINIDIYTYTCIHIYKYTYMHIYIHQ